jgi:hypothetical protein
MLATKPEVPAEHGETAQRGESFEDTSDETVERVANHGCESHE